MTNFEQQINDRIADIFCEYAQGDEDEINSRLVNDRDQLIETVAEEFAEDFSNDHNLTDGDCFTCIVEGFTAIIKKMVDWDYIDETVINYFRDAWQENEETRDAMNIWN